MYNHKEIESRWQKFWEENKTFKTVNPGVGKTPGLEKPKYYCLDMFPYPSGAGLHVGHPEGYTANDIVARYKHACGYNVLHPMGWDAFGLPAENYAIKTGTHPKITTNKNIETFKKQIKSLGFSYDWEREIDTTDPKYYKWTQWIFLKLFEAGLAYEQDLPINYCPSCKTGLANEEVLNDFTCDRCGTKVEKRQLRQWVLAITKYAERLLQDVDKLDWPEGIKDMQRNWIGKSEGCEFEMKKDDDKNKSIRVYTTRIDTVFGMTYAVLAPDHPQVMDFITPEQKEICLQYIEKSKKKSDQDRTADNKEKTGVFTGSYVINPYNNEKVPLWIADYVLGNYGTGAVMAVPAHDERDFEFAKRMGIKIIKVIKDKIYGGYGDGYGDGDGNGSGSGGYNGSIIFTDSDKILGSDFKGHLNLGGNCFTQDGVLVDSGDFTGLLSSEARQKLTAFAEEKGFGTKKVNYKLRDWLFSRQRYWGEPIPLIHLEEKDVLNLPKENNGEAWVKNGNTLMIGNKEFSKIYDGLYTKMVCDYTLPLELPEVKDYEPSGDGNSPLAKIDDFVNVKLAENLSGKRETNTMPQWGGSCWYYLRYMDPHNENELVNPEIEKYWGQVDSYVGGAEHAVLHLLYARFWHKFLFDIGVVSSDEPFYRLRNQGLILAHAFQRKNGGLVANDLVEEKNGKYYLIETGEELNRIISKMSKSLKNVVNPDEIVNEYGADALRLYEMYMADFKDAAPWDSKGIVGVSRFLDKVWRLFMEEKRFAESDEEAMKTLHKTIKKVGEDIENYKFNTAIAQLMICVNTGLPKDELLQKEWKEKFLIILHPFAPHIAEELWKNFTKDTIKQAYLATGNKNKMTRLQMVIEKSNLPLSIDQYQDYQEVEETGNTALENALQKMEPYKAKKRQFPIITTDSGMYFDGIVENPTYVKRNALKFAGLDEKSCNQEQIAEAMSNYYKKLARENGGTLDFHYEDAWVMLLPNDTILTHNYKREYILTDKENGLRDIYFPMRNLYISKITGKYAYEQTEEDTKKEFDCMREMLEKLFSDSIFFASWPEYDEKMTIDDTIKIGVQVNGKLRGDIEITKDESQSSALQKVKENVDIQKWIEGHEIIKEIYVPGRIVSIIVK